MRSLLIAAAAVLFATPGWGAEAIVPAPESSAARPFDSQWLRELKSDSFRVREQACDKIADCGAAAIEPLQQAIESMDREAATRCIGVIERLSKSSAPETAKLALEALKKLESSSNPAVAELANAIQMKSAKITPPPTITGPAGLPRRMPAGGVFQQETRTVNGARTVITRENGKTTETHDVDGKDISVKVTETVNGKEQTTEMKAENVAELRQRSPELADAFEQSTKGVGLLARPTMWVQIPQQDANGRAEASRLYFDALRDASRLQREGKTGTPEHQAATEKLKAAREAMLKP